MSVSLGRPQLPGEEHVRSLLALIADPVKAKARLDALAASEASAKKAIADAAAAAPEAARKLAEANALIAKAEAERKDLAEQKKAVAAQAEAMKAAEAKNNAERLAKREELNKREAAVVVLETSLASRASDLSVQEDQARRTLAEAQALRSQWQAKITQFESIR